MEDLVVSRAAQAPPLGILGLDLHSYCQQLARRGYREATIRKKRSMLTGLAEWLLREHLVLADLDQPRLEQFVAQRRRQGCPGRGLAGTVRQLLEHLHSAGVLPRPEPACDDSPAGLLLGRYEAYLRTERRLVASTVTGYLPFARDLLTQCLGEQIPHGGCLDAAQVRDFLLCRPRHLTPTQVQSMATALRSFLRFLFLRGETETDLALAVPTVRRWHLSTVPRYLPAGDVEHLLQTCDRSTATGRRNRAVLVLLARLGLRASEVVNLELDDLRWQQGEIVVHGKGGQRDRLPLASDVGEALAPYLRQDRPTCASRRVFLCRTAPHRGFAGASTVTTIVRRALASAGLTPTTRGAHLLRHSLATALLRRGASLAEIGQVLRHRSPNTTEVYAKLDFAALREVALPWPTTGGAR